MVGQLLLRHAQPCADRVVWCGGCCCYAGQDPGGAAGALARDAQNHPAAVRGALGRRQARGRALQAPAARQVLVPSMAAPLGPVPTTPVPCPFTKVKLSALLQIVMVKMQASEDERLREAAALPCALDVLCSVSWSVLKKDWDQVRCAVLSVLRCAGLYCW